jgi:hypothetical protein
MFRYKIVHFPTLIKKKVVKGLAETFSGSKTTTEVAWSKSSGRTKFFRTINTTDCPHPNPDHFPSLLQPCPYDQFITKCIHGPFPRGVPRQATLPGLAYHVSRAVSRPIYPIPQHATHASGHFSRGKKDPLHRRASRMLQMLLQEPRMLVFHPEGGGKASNSSAVSAWPRWTVSSASCDRTGPIARIVIGFESRRQ